MRFLFAISLLFSLLVCRHNCFAQTVKIEKSPYKTAEEARTNLGIENTQTSTKIPTNFPLPVYSSNIISSNFTNTTKGLPLADLTLLTRDAPKTVYDWYKSQCAGSGWNVKTPKQSVMSEREKAGQLFIINASKGEQQSSLTISAIKSGETTVNIVWMKHL